MPVTIRSRATRSWGRWEIAPERSARPTLLIAALTDKDAAGIVRSLVPAFPRVVVTQTDSPRALPAYDLATLVRAELDREGRPATDLVAVYPCVPEALGALERAGEAVVAAGTITLAGEVAAFVADDALARPRYSSSLWKCGSPCSNVQKLSYPSAARRRLMRRM